MKYQRPLARDNGWFSRLEAVQAAEEEEEEYEEEEEEVERLAPRPCSCPGCHSLVLKARRAPAFVR